MDPTRVTGVVLAGGAGRRFGRDKALLMLDCETLLARTVRILSRVAGEVLVLGPSERAPLLHGLTARVVTDERPGDGPLPALATALRRMRGDRMVAVATDMPMLNAELLAYLLDRSEGYDATVPRVGDALQPLHAVYTRGCLPFIEAQLARGDLKVDRFVGEVRALIVEENEIAHLDPGLLSLRNVNTPEDWEGIQRMVGSDL
jgi:molybdopterin-guanine dinucleotide biosynthesis protein A